MPLFEYTALSPAGRREKGTIDAESLKEARRTLRTRRVHVVDIVARDGEGHVVAAPSARTITVHRVRSKDLASAYRQLATLLHAGMPLVRALTALVEQLGAHPLGKVIAGVRDRVNEGSTLADALAAYPGVFPNLVVNMIRAGEAAGALESILARLADMSEKRVALTNKVRSAMAYPLFMAVVGVGVIVFLMTFVMPSISKLFVDMNVELPWPTRALMALSDFLGAYFWYLLAAAAMLLFAFRAWLKTDAGTRAKDRFVLHVPLFGDLARKMAVSRFARTMGVLLKSGVTILDALDIVKRVVGNTVVADALDRARESVGHGDSLADPLRRSGVFPPVVFHMVSVGESSGSLEEGLLNVAEAYDNEVASTVTALTSLLEPVMILVMGAAVGFIVVSILLPIFEINQGIQ